jgi:hypothetical protein
LTKKLKIEKALFIGSPLLLRNWEFWCGAQSKTISQRVGKGKEERGLL